MKKRIAVFDFDGTLTTKDSFIEFIKYSCGLNKFYLGILLYSPLLILMKLHLYPNGKTKEKLFTFFFKGRKYNWFAEKGKCFAKIIDCMERKEVVKNLLSHVNHGDTVYIISASMEEWIRPWSAKYNVKNVIGTQIEVIDGVITGKFNTPNCYGQEKIKRLFEVEKDRDSYFLYAYGDSAGDKELIMSANVGKNIKK